MGRSPRPIETEQPLPALVCDSRQEFPTNPFTDAQTKIGEDVRLILTQPLADKVVPPLRHETPILLVHHAASLSIYLFGTPPYRPARLLSLNGLPGRLLVKRHVNIE
jgi:hypothetical protein